MECKPFDVARKTAEYLSSTINYVEDVILFGSAANNTFCMESDIDILVVLQRKSSSTLAFQNLEALAKKFNWRFGHLLAYAKSIFSPNSCFRIHVSYAWTDELEGNEAVVRNVRRSGISLM